jgi:hypothetical protein
VCEIGLAHDSLKRLNLFWRSSDDADRPHQCYDLPLPGLARTSIAAGTVHVYIVWGMRFVQLKAVTKAGLDSHFE